MRKFHPTPTCSSCSSALLVHLFSQEIKLWNSAAAWQQLPLNAKQSSLSSTREFCWGFHLFSPTSSRVKPTGWDRKDLLASWSHLEGSSSSRVLRSSCCKKLWGICLLWCQREGWESLGKRGFVCLGRISGKHRGSWK